MQEYIKKENFHINFGLEDNRKRGIGIGTFADLLQIFFSSCNGPVNDVLREDDHIVYYSDFDASYSWESVMTEDVYKRQTFHSYDYMCQQES